jgi:hypothetical protein
LATLTAGIVLLTACAPARRPATIEHVPTPPPRYELSGYSIVPLQESGWIVVERNSEQIHLARRGANVDESFTISAALTNLPTPLTADKLAQLMKSRESEDVQSDRFRLIRHEVVVQAHPDTVCAKSNFLALDSAPVRQSSRSDPIELEGSALTCRHPRDPKIGVMVGYTHRRYPEYRDAAFQTKAESLFNSLAFTALLPAKTGSAK